MVILTFIFVLNMLCDAIQGNQACKMTELLRENGFKIIHSSIEKFCLFTCVKI
jgi:hypothetical protein